MYVDFVGYGAGLILAIGLFPQLIKSFKTKSTKDISLLWTLLFAFGLLLWVIYGWLIMAYPLIVFSSIELLMTLTLVILKLKYK